MKFTELVSPLNRPICGQDVEILSLVSDSRRVSSGSLFICIEGLKNDGHKYIPEAIKRGASAFIISEKNDYAAKLLLENGIPYLVSTDTRSTEAILTARFHGDPQKKLRIFGVTGTNGKTTVVSVLSAIYSLAGYRCASIGTLTGSMTTPDPAELYRRLLEFSDAGVQYVFMEASSHALSLGKLSPISFEYGIFTNLSPEHLDFHSDINDYAKAKSKLFETSRRSIINLDSVYAGIMAEKARSGVIYCSEKDRDADFYASNITSKGLYGIEYDLQTRNRMIRVKSPMPGRFTVMNTMQAASCAMLDSIPHDIIRGAIGGLKGVRGRLERVPLPTNDFSVYIDFAHTPDALDNVLRTLRASMSKDQRLVLLFGCGGDRDKNKRPVMGAIASSLADYVIITSDNSRSEKRSDIINSILSGMSEHPCPYTVIEDRKDAIEHAVLNAKQGDLILLTGKGHEEYEITSDGIKPFCERDIVIEAAERHLKFKGLY